MQYQNIDSIDKTYQHVYIAPHLDDAAFSCGGLINRQVKAGEAVLVVTVFSADIAAEKKPHDPALKNVVDTARRRAEDLKAMHEMGVDHLWLDYPDWIFRHRHPLYRYSLSPGLLRGERELTERIAYEIRDICQKTGTQRLYLPLGVGQHADHQLVFQSGLEPARRKRTGPQLVFYEEIPYTLFPNLLYYRLMSLGQDPGQSREPDLTKPRGILSAGREFFCLLREVPTLLGGKTWLRWLAYGVIWGFLVYVCLFLRPRSNVFGEGHLTAEQIDIEPDAEKKFSAIRCYPSQIEQIPDYPGKMEKMLRAYSIGLSSGTRRFTERYWILWEE